MVIEGPILAAIWTAVLGIAKAIWDVATKAASRAAFYFATVVPMILRWFVKYRAFALALVVAVAVILRTFFNLAYSAVNSTLHLDNFMQSFITHFKWMYWLMINGPLALDRAYSHLPDLFSLWISLLLVRWAWMKSRWAIFIAEKKFKSS